MQRALIIGCGSIGLRHKKVLESLSFSVFFVSMRTDLKDLEPYMFRSLTEAFLDKKGYSLVIIANETIKHEKSLKELESMHYRGPVLVEKPLFASCSQPALESTDNIFVGYNLRFHPLVQRIKKLIAHTKVYSAQLHVGQYLPTWRERDYRYIYSSKKSMGGGVLRDLSHELDLAYYLFGNVKTCVSNIGRFSDLQIDSEDSVDVLSVHEKCAMVSVHLDYTDNIKKRYISLQCDRLSIEADFINNTLSVDNMVEPLRPCDTYTLQDEAIITRSTDVACSYAQGLEIMKYIQMIEKNCMGGV
ncbi:Uncharacterised protein [Anaerobiospirillum thomasii]|uniref:GFO/IDH/MocA-like oxidoreductase domain-containing protein n=1 Tax=Anaerobiospirillum thomasii TaxID=179995 RepID=A0A2X0VBY1_9GAMM|nr:Gfo/Idh/MocA family oxidoreductase [Anaerobiospirillum thomasii]SPT69508.1 Uncharacterised protein [Anaerobiospirillum thomasii]SPT71929.1 Uncharacterised protein [Anaerobiospirillum thomasii]